LVFVLEIIFSVPAIPAAEKICCSAPRNREMYFWLFWRFWRLIESVTYVISTWPVGSILPAGTTGFKTSTFSQTHNL
jgi:hypothetical protein